MSELPPWRSPLARALHRNRSLPHLRFVQLATVDIQGHPHNRTIVYRGLIDETHQLQFVTDSRSDKILHLQVQPWVEVCWYFTKTREQFRFSGTMTTIGSDNSVNAAHNKHRSSAWQRLSKNAQRQFYWPNPGEKRSSSEAFEGIEPSPLPPDSFALLLLTPMQVEHLQLRGNPQDRDRFIYRTKGWIRDSLNP